MNGNIKESEKALRGKIVALPSIDKTLTKSGMCADAKATGDKINAVARRMDSLDPHFANAISYSRTESKLEATNVQAAIDELADMIKELKE